MAAMRALGGLVRFGVALALGAAGTVGGVAPAASGASMPAALMHQAVAGHGHAHSHRHVIGRGTPARCTSAAVVRAVNRGGHISFNCGPDPITITMKATAKVENTSHHIVLDGGGLVTLSGGGKRQILYMNTCDKSRTWTTSHCQDQKWPQLLVRNLTFRDGNAATPQTPGNPEGGGAIFASGGRLHVVHSHFIDNRCFHSGPDLGGGAIRALEQWQGRPVHITRDTFRGGRCSNGSALSSIGVSWVVSHSRMVNNRATGTGANPATPGTPGGGSGGAIYTDGDNYSVTIVHTVIRKNRAREGGGAIFFVSNNRTGNLTIEHSRLHHNPSAGFWTRPYTGVFFEGHHIRVRHSTLD
jgi:hypothetical protein